LHYFDCMFLFRYTNWFNQFWFWRFKRSQRITIADFGITLTFKYIKDKFSIRVNNKGLSASNYGLSVTRNDIDWIDLCYNSFECEIIFLIKAFLWLSLSNILLLFLLYYFLLLFFSFLIIFDLLLIFLSCIQFETYLIVASSISRFVFRVLLLEFNGNYIFKYLCFDFSNCIIT